MFDTCLSVYLSTPSGGTRDRSRWGGGYPSQVQLGGGTPPWYPPSDLAGGYPDGEGTPPRVPPHQTWRGVPWGYPTSGTPPPPSDLARGVPHLQYPPPRQTWPGGGGGTPPLRGRCASGVHAGGLKDLSYSLPDVSVKYVALISFVSSFFEDEHKLSCVIRSLAWLLVTTRNYPDVQSYSCVFEFSSSDIIFRNGRQRSGKR